MATCQIIFDFDQFLDNTIDSNKPSEAYLYWTVLTAIVSKKNYPIIKKMLYYITGECHFRTHFGFYAKSIQIRSDQMIG